MAEYEDAILIESVSWDQRNSKGVLSAFFSTLLEVANRPVWFFTNCKTESLGSSILFYLMLNVLSAVMGLVLGAIFSGLGFALNPISWTLVVFKDVVLFPTLSLVLIFPLTALCHLGVTVMGGRRGFKDTFSIFVFAAVPTLLYKIPALGFFVGGIWCLVLSIVGIQVVHGLSVLRSIAAYFMSGLVVSVICLILISVGASLVKRSFEYHTSAAASDQAQALIGDISAEAELFALDHKVYPGSFDELAAERGSPDLENPCGRKMLDYYFRCYWGDDGYEIVAEPLRRDSGLQTLSISTGGVINIGP